MMLLEKMVLLNTIWITDLLEEKNLSPESVRSIRYGLIRARGLSFNSYKHFYHFFYFKDKLTVKGNYLFLYIEEYNVK